MEATRNNVIMYDEDYNNLPTNAAGAKEAKGIPNGTQGEVVEKNGKEIITYLEAFNGYWYER